MVRKTVQMETMKMITGDLIINEQIVPMKFRTALFTVVFFLLHTVTYGQVFKTDSGLAKFTSSVPLHEFKGTSSYLIGMVDFDENLVDFYLDLETLKTGNSRRDRDMYNTLNVEEYPFAEFTGKLDTPFDFSSNEKQQVIVSGEFTIHGISCEMTIKGSLQKQNGILLLEAEWVHDITDHDIEPPGILFYRVRDEMDVRIEATLINSSD